MAHAIEPHEPGARQCWLQAEKPIVNVSGPYVEYGAVEGPVTPYQ
jgi:hypothetical protein